MGWLAGWAKREAITVTNGTADLTDFTKVVILTADTKRADALATGYDIRFTASDGTTLLYHKREAWAGGGGSNVDAIFKVKVPSIYHTTGAAIYIYWGKAGAPDTSDTVNCWDANLVEAWDMKDLTTSTIAGDKGYGLNKIEANGPIEGTGIIGKAQVFDGSNDFITGATSPTVATTNITMSAWANVLTTSEKGTIVHNGSNAGNGYTLGVGNTTLDTAGNNLIVLLDGVAFLNFAKSIGTGWHLLSVTRGANTWLGYVDGVVSATTFTTNPTAPNTGFRIGKDVDGAYARLWNSGIDDVRVSTIARAAEWLEYQFGEINEAGNRLAWGGVENASSGHPAIKRFGGIPFTRNQSQGVQIW